MHGRSAHAVGLVITRQRPDTATGVVFLTLADETGPLRRARLPVQRFHCCRNGG